MATRPATLRREKVGSFSTWAIRLARKVSPKSRASVVVWCGYHRHELPRQDGGITILVRLAPYPGKAASTAG